MPDSDHDPHPNVSAWKVHADLVTGNNDVPVGRNIVSPHVYDSDERIATVYVYVDKNDGSVVVQVDRSVDRVTPVRVTISNSATPMSDGLVVYHDDTELTWVRGDEPNLLVAESRKRIWPSATRAYYEVQPVPDSWSPPLWALTLWHVIEGKEPHPRSLGVRTSERNAQIYAAHCERYGYPGEPTTNNSATQS